MPRAPTDEESGQAVEEDADWIPPLPLYLPEDAVHPALRDMELSVEEGEILERLPEEPQREIEGLPPRRRRLQAKSIGRAVSSDDGETQDGE